MAKPLFKPLLLLLVVATAVLVWRGVPRSGSSRPPAINQAVEAAGDFDPDLFGQSADGQVILRLNRQDKTNDTIWNLQASLDNKNLETIWSATLPTSAKLAIPFNAVSPDNQYLFLKQVNGDQISYPVLTTNGEPLTAEASTVDLAEQFKLKHPEFNLTEVTGWGGVHLIVFNTNNDDGSPGPSFWFEVPSGAFIRLSNRFN